MIVLGIDPGQTQSGYARFDGKGVIESGVALNDWVLERIRTLGAYVGAELHQPVTLAVERFEARGMPIGEDSIETIIWTGRFVQAWHRPNEVAMVRRSKVKQYLCGTQQAKDAHIRQSLIDLLGEPGTKKRPGPTHGVASHAWAALAVALVAHRGIPQ